jgi:hypothetical protein
VTRDPPAHLLADVQPASRGHGPLLQRDYWAVIAGCRLTPAELITLICERFPEFPPRDLLRFRATVDRDQKGLQVGDILEIDMGIAGHAAVRVMTVEEQTITLATLNGHPEAGRITFGAYRNTRGDVVFHIRSRARSASRIHYLGFLIAGDPMQTNSWTDFIDRLAHCVGDGVIEAIHTDVRRLNDEDGPDVVSSPTFVATGN